MTQQTVSLKTDRSSWLPQLLCGFLLSFTVFIFAPIDMYLLNKPDFWFSLGDFVPMQLLLFAICFVAIEGVMALIRLTPERVYNGVLALLFGLSVSVYIQGNILCTTNEVWGGIVPQWHNMIMGTMSDLLIWCAIIFGSLLIMTLKPGFFKKAIAAVSALLMIMMGTSLVVSLISAEASKVTDVYTSTEKMLTYSGNGDVAIFMMDTFDSRLMDQVLDDDPDYLKELDGATYYPNTAGTFRKTDPSILAVFTGQIYKNEVPFFQFCNEAFDNNTFFTDMIDNGVSVTIYGEETLYNDDMLTQIENLEIRESSVLSRMRFTGIMQKMIAYRYGPPSLQPFLYMPYVAEFDSQQKLLPGKPNRYTQMYTGPVGNLAEEGLSIDNSTRYFKFYAMRGSHEPHNLNRYGKVVPDNTVDKYEMTLGSLSLINQYVAEMKAKGIYDSTTIIIMADHGYGDNVAGALNNPTFIVKPANAHGEIAVSNAKTSLMDVRATVLDAFGIDYSAYGKPAHLWTAEEQRERLFFSFEWRKPSGGGFYLNDITEYAIPDDATDIGNYTETGNVYRAP
ncbi:sulfatase-like hydrolase/transferase [Eubacteriales bacterium OttesenSCG-928-N13]|nr:sulfatase-like hydrolase/transferase [Eubacteriales bacterium OttesenSCG-928-N13]